MYHVYVIRSNSSGRTYIGHTDNLEERVRQHNSGYGRSTKKYSDWNLIYDETYPTRSLAMKREKYLKSGDGRRILKSKKIL